MLQSFVPKFLIPLAFALLPLGAEAHAVLLDSNPAANARVSGLKIPFALRYNSRIDHERSRLTLTLPDHSTRVLPIDPASPDDALDSTAELPPGNYSLRWQVLAVDGHITRGDVPFTVGGGE